MRWLNFLVKDAGIEKEIVLKEEDVSMIEIEHMENRCDPEVVTIIAHGKRYVSEESYEEVMETLLGEPLYKKNKGGE